MLNGTTQKKHLVFYHINLKLEHVTHDFVTRYNVVNNQIISLKSKQATFTFLVNFFVLILKATYFVMRFHEQFQIGAQLLYTKPSLV